MGRCLVKLADEEYVEWSTVVDAPVTWILTREEMIAYLRDEYGRAREHETPERLERCEQRGHSALWPGARDDDSAAEFVRYNRAGEGEAEATLEEIRERYRAPAEAT